MTAAVRTNAAVIPNNGTTSQSIDLSAYGTLEGLVAFVLPAAFTGTAITFNVSFDDVTYQQLTNASGSAISLTVAQGKSYGFTQDIRSAVTPWRYIQFVSGSTEGAARTINFIVK
jgi:hypothetical protein